MRIAFLIFAVAVAANYPWELAQLPLFAGTQDWRASMAHCFLAALGDGVLVLAIYWAGSLTLRRRDWFRPPGAAGYAFMAGAGLVIAVAAEWLAVHVAGRWTYSQKMPVIPGMEVGLVPVLQMLVLPPLIFWLVTRLVRA